ncbi:MAG: PAS domain S-box protein [Candidatus Kapaibacterium sp.]|nr:MAG: PAS domain S-box protein [Candidatus Kapabacteria bacterium]
MIRYFHKHLLWLISIVEQRRIIAYFVRFGCQLCCLLIIIFFGWNRSFAQNRDSLLNIVLSIPVENTARAIPLEQLVGLYMDAKPDSALIFAEQLSVLAKQHPSDKMLLARSLTALLNAYNTSDKPDRMLPLAFQLLGLAQDLHDTIRIARAMHGIGYASGQQVVKNNPQENAIALEYLKKALAIALHRKEPLLTAKCYNAIGRMYRKEQQFDSALPYHQHALTLAKEYRFPLQKAWALHSMALCLLNNGNLPQSLEHGLEAVRVYEQIGNPFYVAISLHTITKIYEKMGALRQALAFAFRSYDIAIASNASKIAYEVSERITNISEVLGEYHTALEYHRRFVSLRDAVTKVEFSNNVEGLQKEMEYERNARVRLQKEQQETSLIAQQQRSLLIITAISLAIFAVAMFMLLYGQRRTKRHNAELIQAITEREKVEEKLRLHSLVLETLAEGVMVCDATGIITYTNHSLDEMLGYERGELLGQSAAVANNYTDEQNTVRSGKLIEYLHTHKSWNGELINLKKDGSLFPTLTNINVLHEGETMYWISTKQDITERKAKEQELKLLRDVLNLAPVAIRIVDSNGKFVFVNDNLCKTSGFSREMFLASTVQQVFPHTFPNADRWEQYFGEIRQHGFLLQEAKMMNKFGVQSWAEVHASYVKVGDQEYSFALVNDITERKRQGEELRRFKTLLDQSSDAIYIIDLDTGRYVDSNRKAYQSLGYTQEELHQIAVMDVATHIADLPTWRGRVDLVLRTDELTFETSYRRRDGMSFPVEITAQVQTFDEKQYMVAVVRDITERKRQHQELELIRNLMNLAHEAICVVNPETGQFLFVNDLMCANTGLEREKLLTLKASDVETFFEAPGAWEKHVEIIRAKKASYGEGRQKRPDGSTYPVEATVSIISLDGTEFLISFMRNITERKQQEREMYIIRDLLNRSGDAISVLNARTGLTLFANDSVCANLGRTRDELAQIPVWELETIFEETGSWERHVEEMREKRTALVQGAQKRSDGTTFPVEVRVSLIDYENEEFEFVITRDITERQKAAQELAHSQKILKDAQKLAKLGSWEFDLRTQELSWSDETYTIFGLERIPVGNLYEVYRNKLRPGARERLDSLLQAAVKNNSKDFEYEHTIANTDGSEKYILGIGEIFRDEFGSPIKIMGAVQDITERKLVENKLFRTANLLTNVINSSQDMIFVKDTELRTILCNTNLIVF